jgi:hypothetical protein
MALDVDLYIDQGADFTVQLDVTAEDGSALDLTGYTVTSQMRRSYYSLTATSITSTVLSAPDGTIQLSLPASATRNLWPARYLYDVAVTSGSGVVSRVFEGMITVTPGVTAVPKPEHYEQ